MSIHDMVTYRDPATPGMAFGRPPTRPGHRRAVSVPSADAGGRAVAMTVDAARADATPADATAAQPPPVDPDATAANAPPVDPDATAAHAPSVGQTTAHPASVDADGTEASPRSHGADDTRADADGTEDTHRSPDADDTHAEADTVDPSEDAEADTVDPSEDAEADMVDPSEDDLLDPPRAESEPEGGAAAEPEPRVALHAEDPTPAAKVDGSVALSPDGGGPESLLGTAEVADLRRRWGAVQAGFVDDPRRAVEVADDIVAEAVDALQAAVDDRRHAVAEPWRDDAGASTDALLAAFHAYRALFDRVLSA